MTLYYAKVEPQTVEKIVYAFSFKDLGKTEERVQRLYGLRKDKVIGEHRLFSGERIVIDLKPGGSGSIEIVNDAQIKKDQTASTSAR